MNILLSKTEILHFVQNDANIYIKKGETALVSP